MDVFFNVCLHSRSFPLCADWRKSDSSVDGEPQGDWRRNSDSGGVVASAPSFPVICKLTKKKTGALCQVARTGDNLNRCKSWNFSDSS